MLWAAIIGRPRNQGLMTINQFAVDIFLETHIVIPFCFLRSRTIHQAATLNSLMMNSILMTSDIELQFCNLQHFMSIMRWVETVILHSNWYSFTKNPTDILFLSNEGLVFSSTLYALINFWTISFVVFHSTLVSLSACCLPYALTKIWCTALFS